MSGSVSRRLHSRRDEFLEHQWLRIKVGTWNIAALDDTKKDFREWLVDCPFPDCSTNPNSLAYAKSRNATAEPDDDVDIYVVGLQEIVDVASPTETFRPYTDPTKATPFKEALQAALPRYRLVAEQQLVGLLVLVYVSPSIAPQIRKVHTGYVGTGLMGYLGNKGAVGVRLLVGETSFVFLNAHLAAGDARGSCERRDWDAQQIITKMRFGLFTPADGATKDELAYEPEGEALFGESISIGDEDYTFWIGDLNYRLALKNDDVRKLLGVHVEENSDKALPTRARGSSPEINESDFEVNSGWVNSDESEGECDIEADPASIQTTIDSLLAHDQLSNRLRTGPSSMGFPVSGVLRQSGTSTDTVFSDGWREGRIRFGPSYKFDVGQVNRFDSSEKRRSPAWCDRVLWRTKEQRNKPGETVGSQKEGGGNEHADRGSTLYDYDDLNGPIAFSEPTTPLDIHKGGAKSEAERGARGSFTANPPEVDDVILENYTSHPHIITSDHKPVVATFLVRVRCADREKQLKVYQDIVRVLDRDENERRPTITVVAEGKEEPSIDFGHVPLLGRSRGEVTVANTGQVPARIRLVGSGYVEGESSGFPDFLKARIISSDYPQSNAETATIEPGETTKVVVEVEADSISSIRALNRLAVSTKSHHVQEILVLRLDGGRDYFVPLSIDWDVLCLGFSIEELVCAPEGGVSMLVKAGKSAEKKELGSSVVSDLQPRWSAPREVFKIIEILEQSVERAVAESSMLDWKPESQRWPFIFEAITDGTRLSLVVIGERKADSNDSLEDLLAMTNLLAAISSGDVETSSVLDLCLPAWRRAEIAAKALAFLLCGMGPVVSSGTWASMLKPAIKMQVQQTEPRTQDDARSEYLDLLAQAHAHTVTFLFLTGGLGRIATELASIDDSVEVQPEETLKVPERTSISTQVHTPLPSPVPADLGPFTASVDEDDTGSFGSDSDSSHSKRREESEIEKGEVAPLPPPPQPPRPLAQRQSEEGQTEAPAREEPTGETEAAFQPRAPARAFSFSPFSLLANLAGNSPTAAPESPAQAQARRRVEIAEEYIRVLLDTPFIGPFGEEKPSKKEKEEDSALRRAFLKVFLVEE